MERVNGAGHVLTMERANGAGHVLANSSNSPANDSTTNATIAAPSLKEPWSVQKSKSSPSITLHPNPPSSSIRYLSDTPTKKTPLTLAVLSGLPSPPPTNPTSPIHFLHILERLKTTPREGWRRFSIPGSESISDHMYRMSILTLLTPTPLRHRLNIPRCTLLALVHDMAESLVGDLTPLDGVPKREKSRRERDTISYFQSTLLDPGTGIPAEAGTLIREAWEEYETGETLEAKYVHDVDKLELMIQMMEYERRGEGKVDLGELLTVAERIEMEEMKGWCRDVLREREEFWKGVGKVPGWVDIADKVLGKKKDDGEREERNGCDGKAGRE
ncbi:MAG: hypothetical protein Q9166_006215 [cf. Caloplaca sp. 2 TL-2023]